MRKNSRALLALLISVIMGSFGSSTALFQNSSKIGASGSADAISLTQKQGIANQAVEAGKWKSTTVEIENGSSHNLDVETELTISKPLPKGMSVTVNGKSAFVGKTKEIYTHKDLKPKGSSEVASYEIKVKYDKLTAGERMESGSFTLSSKSIGKLRGTNWTTKQLSSSATITYDGGNNTLKVPVIYKPIGTLGEGKLTATLKSPDSTEETVNVLNSKGGVDLDQVSHSKGTYFQGTLEVYNDQELQFISNSGSWNNDDLGIILPNSKGGNAKIIRGSGPQVDIYGNVKDVIDRSDGTLHLIRIPRKQVNFTSGKAIKDTFVLKNDKGKVIDKVLMSGMSAKSKFVDTHEFNVNMPMSKIHNFEYTHKKIAGYVEFEGISERYKVTGSISTGFHIEKVIIPTFKFSLLDDDTYSINGFVDDIDKAIAINDLDPSFKYNPVIPSEYKSKPVTTIGVNAFRNNQLTSVVIPDSVTEINAWAFYGNQLTSVDIPDSVTKIKESTFWNNKLTSVVIPASVTEIEWSAFRDNQLTSVVIPDSVTVIGDQAFLRNELTSVVIPDSVTKITWNAFSMNPGGIVYANELEGDSWRTLRGYKFDSNWHLVDYNAYGKLSKLFKFTKLDDGTYSVDGFVDNIDEVITENGIKPEFRYNPILPSEYEGKPVTTIGSGAFYKSQLTSVDIPDSVTKIRAQAFAYNELTSVVIPDSVTTIGNRAFENNELTSVVIPNSVTSIGLQVFAINELTSVVIPDSVTSISGSAFANNKLTSVVIPDSVTSIGRNAFAGNPGGVIYANQIKGDSWPTLRSYEFNSLWSRKPLSEYKK